MKTPSARNVPALLQALHQEGYTGTVRVSGVPGGTIHLRDGLIGAIETPGAPTATSALLASGRIEDDAWLAARAAEPDADRLDLHLVAAGLIGAAELEVVCTAAVFDGAFAMALSPPGGWELTEREPTLLARPGVEPRPLAEETTRRMALLTRLWGPAGELARVRPEPVIGDSLRPEPVAGGRVRSEPGMGDPVRSGAIAVDRVRSEPVIIGEAIVGTPATGQPAIAQPATGRGAPEADSDTPAADGGHPKPGRRGLTRRHQDLIESVNGRRTPRDLAFARGRGLYAVMLDLIRLETLQAVRWETGTTFDGRPSTAPRVLQGQQGQQGQQASDEPSPRAGPLPRRRPGEGSPFGDLGAKGG
ncbi:hypothetical protein [Streptomyces adelaidensis]|uniref:hypothetical protein n=1 Tax=Streptomyces adelaidensis TaxID=2796465 RepID=UPI0027DADD44|nr:hypothetical protein [Streptomyces adelaidensis]